MADEAMIQEYMKLLETQEPLHPDLEPYYSEDEGMPMVRHPLAYSVPHSPQFNARVNQMYLHKKQALVEARNERRWYHYIGLYERPYRFDALMEIADEMAPEEYWEALAYVYTDSENIYQNVDDWRDLLAEHHEAKHLMMEEGEREALEALPATLTIYRGDTEDSDFEDALSWTLSQEKAEWFSRRNSRFGRSEPRVLKMTISKDRVIAYLLGRGEEEILILPNSELDQPERISGN